MIRGSGFATPLSCIETESNVILKIEPKNMKATHANDAKRLEDIPNIGKAMAQDFRLLGISAPNQLIGLDPYHLYEEIQRITGHRHDPCVCDTYIAAVRFMEGGKALPWWHYTLERKKYFKNS
jgi:Pathogenicity locus